MHPFGLLILQSTQQLLLLLRIQTTLFLNVSSFCLWWLSWSQVATRLHLLLMLAPSKLFKLVSCTKPVLFCLQHYLWNCDLWLHVQLPLADLFCFNLLLIFACTNPSLHLCFYLLFLFLTCLSISDISLNHDLGSANTIVPHPVKSSWPGFPDFAPAWVSVRQLPSAWSLSDNAPVYTLDWCHSWCICLLLYLSADPVVFTYCSDVPACYPFVQSPVRHHLKWFWGEATQHWLVQKHLSYVQTSC